MNAKREPPEFRDLILKSAEGWEDARPFPDNGLNVSFVSGDPRSLSIRVRYYQKKSEKLFAGRAWFGPGAEGPPGYAHGGSQAALLDEGMGAVAWLSGHSVVAAKIEINFRIPLPLGTTLTVWGEIDRVEGRKVFTRGRIESDTGQIYADGTGLFIVIDPEEIKKRVKKA